MNTHLALIALLLLSFATRSALAAPSIEGEWVLADGAAVVAIAPAAAPGTVTATVRALLRPRFTLADDYGQPGTPRTDLKNPDPALRNRPLVGLAIAPALRADGKAWSGTLYDPGSGHTYRCTIRLLDEEFAEVRGYVGISLLGRSMVWQRRESYRRGMMEMLGSGTTDTGDPRTLAGHE